MRSAPGPPTLQDPLPPSAHAHLGGGRILKGRLRQCAQQRTSRDQRPSANPQPSANSLNHPFSGPWRQWRQHRLNCSSSAGTFSACCCRCSGTPCRRWRTPCRGPGGTCWESAAGPPTEAPAPSPGRPCHQVLLCISPSMGASATQE